MRRTAAILFSLFFITFFSPLSAEPRLELQLAPTTRVVLPNGLRLLVRERDDTNNVAIYLTVGAGQLTEVEDEMGITNLLQNYLLESPAKNYHDASSAVEAQGGVASAESGPDSSSFSFVVPPSVFPFALKVLKDLLHQNEIHQDVFEEVKKNTLTEIKNSQNESFQALYSIFLQEFYTFHPYRVPTVGLPSTVKEITPPLLLNYYKSYYVPNNMVLAIVGKVDTDRAIHLVNDYFSDLHGKMLQSQYIYYQPVLSDDKDIDLEQSGNIAWVFMGFSAPDLKSDDYEAMEIINSLLGSSIGSRIWISLREKRGLSYELGSRYSAREGPSHFVIYAATEPKHLGESRSGLLKQIDLMRDKPVANDELEVVKRNVIGHFILSLETNGAQAKFLSWGEISGKGMMFDRTYISLIRAVTSEDILRVARKYLENHILISVQ